MLDSFIVRSYWLVMGRSVSAALPFQVCWSKRRLSLMLVSERKTLEEAGEEMEFAVQLGELAT